MMMTEAQHTEIAKTQCSNKLTTRATSKGLEDMLHTPMPVLDHGFVRVVDYMGNDEAIVQAARVSYGSGTKEISDDRGLIRYLMRHHHSTPFEMCEIKLHVKLPIFVARQWIRHRTANVNEYSARYSIMDREFYIPASEHMAAQSTDNKQGRGETLTEEQAKAVRKILIEDAGRSYDHYELMMGDPEKLYCNDKGDFIPGYGLARELARMNLPANIYTQWYWKTDLHNLFHFLRLRADPHAQFEIRCYAQAICEFVKEWVPHAYEAFVDYRQEAQTFSKQQMQFIRDLLEDDPHGWLSEDVAKAYGMSAREAREMVLKLKGM